LEQYPTSQTAQDIRQKITAVTGKYPVNTLQHMGNEKNASYAHEKKKINISARNVSCIYVGNMWILFVEG
jgi:hypothetical protein